LVEISGRDAKVCFVHQGETVYYSIPAIRLERSRITYPDQPFEMDEIEFRTPSGELGQGYICRPLASKSDKTREVLKFNEARESKLAALLKAKIDAKD
ncbi:MAG TPA: hypothetical protein VHY22_09605, partial [Chthoniobacteraceae bacterium]|nr:hypothetical protein [Chthoniobacteraceae bacterium]